MLSDHQGDGCPSQECKSVSVDDFRLLGQPTTAVESADGSLDDPPLGQNDELSDIGALDDIDKDLGAHATPPFLEFRPLIAIVDIMLEEERKQTE